MKNRFSIFSIMISVLIITSVVILAVKANSDNSTILNEFDSDATYVYTLQPTNTSTAATSSSPDQSPLGSVNSEDPGNIPIEIDPGASTAQSSKTPKFIPVNPTPIITPDPIITHNQNTTPTPTPDETEKLKVQFSLDSGFYTGNLNLTLSVPDSYKNSGYTIRYTLNGSIPNSASPSISNGGQVQINNSYNSNTENVIIVRAAMFSNNNITGFVQTKTYIKSTSGNISRRYDMPVISLVTDPANLTNLIDNCMIKGSEWERPVHIDFIESNGSLGFSQDGGIKIFGGVSRSLAQKSFKIYARNQEKISALTDMAGKFSSPIYDGKGKFNYVIFPGRKTSSGTILDKFDSFLLRNASNDSMLFSVEQYRSTNMRDGIVNRLGAKTGVDYYDYRPSVVYLNGQYYGILNLRENESDSYISNIYGIEDKENITYIATERLENQLGYIRQMKFYYDQGSGPVGDLDSYISLCEGIINGSISYDQAAQKIDMDDFIHYMAFEMYVCNTDWPYNNVNLWRYAGTPGSGYKDGKWRYMYKDMDFALGRYTVANYTSDYNTYLNINQNMWELYNLADMNTFEFVLDNPYKDPLYIGRMLKQFLKNPTFKNNFINYCKTLANDICSPQNVRAEITKGKNEIQKELSLHVIRWNVSMDNWDYAINEEYNFADQRPAYFLQYLDAAMKKY